MTEVINKPPRSPFGGNDQAPVIDRSREGKVSEPEPKAKPKRLAKRKPRA